MDQGAADAGYKLWTKNFILICLSTLVAFMSFQILMPTLPVYVALLGGKESEAGLVIGCFTISAVIIRPLAGLGVDIYGRLSFYLLGLVVFLLSSLSYIWAQTIIALLLVRFLHGLGWGGSSTASGAIVADAIPKQRWGEGMGYYGLTATISMAVAPALGLYIIKRWDFNVLFLVSLSLALLALIIGLFIQYKKTPPDEGIRPSLFEKNALRPSLIIFFVATSYGAIVSFIALYAAQKGISNIGLYFTVCAIVSGLTRPISGLIIDRRGYDVVVIPGILSNIAGMILLSQAGNLWFFLLSAFFYGLGLGGVPPTMQALAVKDVSFSRRGAATGTVFTAFDLGIALGALFWGIVSQVTGYGAMYLLAASPCAAALFLYLLTGKNKKQAGLLPN